MLLFNKKPAKRYVFGLFAILILMTSGVMISCGSSGSENEGGSSVFDGSGLLPDGVKATVDGDSDGCYSDYDPSCMDNSCITAFMEGLSELDYEDPNFDTLYEELEDEYEACEATSHLDCDMTSSFMISITLTNTTTQTITFTLPGGLTFVPSDSGYQPMMIIEEITVTIEADETITQCLAVFCLALDLHAPDEEAVFTEYNIVDPSGSGCLSEIMEILADVNFSEVSYSDYQKIQDVIWSCTEGGSIDTDEEAFLNSLPTAKKQVKNSSSLRTQKKCPACMLKKLDLIK